MSSSERASRAGLPSTHYFVSISRGDSIRTVRLRPARLWSLVALAALSLAFGVGGSADLALRSTLPTAVVEVASPSATERRAPDREADPRGAEMNALEDRIRDLAARQQSLERRSAALAALAAEAAKLPAAASASPSPVDALGAIERLAPDGVPTRPATPGDAARAYAPAPAALGPRRFDASQAAPAAAPSLADAALNADLDPRTRLDLVVLSLDQLDEDERAALAIIDRRAFPAVARDSAILAGAGLDPEWFAARAPTGNSGGPLVPVDTGSETPTFERDVARVARNVSVAERLEDALMFAPLRKPLVGEAEVTSPFGYRADPFLGRLALHTGVDLVQPFGSAIRATGAGRVVRAGVEGGYGDSIEIDHGFGLSTVYGHLSEIDVAEGQSVSAGAVLGRLGSTGRSTGPHLHYEVRVDGEPVDPERFMRAGAALP